MWVCAPARLSDAGGTDGAGRSAHRGGTRTRRYRGDDSGFLAAFGAFGLLTVTVAATVERFLPYVTIVIGISLVALGFGCCSAAT